MPEHRKQRSKIQEGWSSRGVTVPASQRVIEGMLKWHSSGTWTQFAEEGEKRDMETLTLSWMPRPSTRLFLFSFIFMRLCLRHTETDSPALPPGNCLF